MTDSSASTSKGYVLYIEDNPLNAKLVQRVLAAEDYEVRVAVDGLKGIDSAIERKPDIILMDINLPDMSGREVTTRLRAIEDFKTIPIVALTAQTDEKQRAMTIAAGVDGYITKPFDVEELVQRVAFHLKGGKEQFQVNLTEAQQQYSQELVTHLERKLREVEAINDELRRMDKIKSDFIQRVAHELRTPITIIYGYSRLIQTADLIKPTLQAHPEFRAYVDGLVESIERMHVLVNEILTIYRIVTGEVEAKLSAINLASLVENVLADFKKAAEQRKMNIRFTKSEWPTTVTADNELLTLAFTNLVGNAIKYTPDSGTVTLKCESLQDKLKIQIRDTGIGISKEDQKRIFEHFFSGSNTDLHSTSKTAFQGGGLGLGLSITKGIIEAHQGTIRVESAGKDEQKLLGSNFIIEIPHRKNYETLSSSSNSTRQEVLPEAKPDSGEKPKS